MVKSKLDTTIRDPLHFVVTAQVTALFFLVLTLASVPIASFAFAKVGSSVGWLYRVDPEAPPDLYADYQLGPVEQWLNQWDLRDYRKARTSGKCGRATIVLRKAFKLRYPDGPDPLGSYDPEGRASYRAFAEFAIPRHYPDLAVCTAVEFLNACFSKLQKLEQQPKRFPQYAKRSWENDVTSEQQRCRYDVSHIVHLSMRDIGHAHIKLVELSEVGEIIRLTPEYRYYALLRAQAQSVPSAKLASWLTESRAGLSGETRAEVEARAAYGKWPKTAPLVLDGQRSTFEIWLRWLFRLLTGIG